MHQRNYSNTFPLSIQHFHPSEPEKLPFTFTLFHFYTLSSRWANENTHFHFLTFILSDYHFLNIELSFSYFYTLPRLPRWANKAGPLSQFHTFTLLDHHFLNNALSLSYFYTLQLSPRWATHLVFHGHFSTLTKVSQRSWPPFTISHFQIFTFSISHIFFHVHSPTVTQVSQRSWLPFTL